MPKKTARRTRSKHPGVMIIKRTLPSGLLQWRARWTDPDTGRKTERAFARIGLTTHEQRRAWAITKSKSLAALQAQRDAGVEQAESLELGQAVEEYLARVGQRLRPVTVEGYRFSAGQFLSWAKSQGLLETEDLSPERLHRLRDHLSSQPKRVSSKGGARGAREITAKSRSAVSVNRELREIKTMLAAWIDRGYAPRVRQDDLRRALKPLPVNRKLPDFLEPQELRALLRAALRHDQASYSATRDEHARHSSPGSTRRYGPIAPYIALVLLTGMRRNEALSLRWEWVKLDGDGSWQDGVILLPAELTKTARGRQVDLAVSPALRQLLLAMKLRTTEEKVFGALTKHAVDAARERLIHDYGAPKKLTWQGLRRTCSTVLSNANGIFPAGIAAFKSAKQLGHSITIAESRYAGLIKIDPGAKTLEDAMGICSELREALGIATGKPSTRSELGILPVVAN